ncbi:MAG TPA: SCO family protein [Chthoniobacteraceae bacterium]|jgi:protein SCO1/2|nr:SCO family protein [Chthoniobacteraceae bacterium]
MRRCLALIFLLSAGAIVTGCQRRTVAESLPATPAQLSQQFWAVPDFSLTERTGSTITAASLKGKVWVADFFYTTCPGPCPMLSSRLSDIQRLIGPDERVRLVSISTDPEKDTPEVLQQYAERFQASDRWLFLTGDKAQIFDLGIRGFKLPIVEDRSAAEPITHSTRLILIDQSGAIRGFYEGVGEEGPERIVGDIRRLLDAPPRPAS